MTEQDEPQREGEKDTRLEDILRTVSSIDRNVDAILDRLSEHLDSDSYNPYWDCNDYMNNHGH